MSLREAQRRSNPCLFNCAGALKKMTSQQISEGQILADKIWNEISNDTSQ